MGLYDATVLQGPCSRKRLVTASSVEWCRDRRGREMREALVYFVCQAVGSLLLGFPNSTHPSEREWPRLPLTARIERAHSYCARPASKKGI